MPYRMLKYELNIIDSVLIDVKSIGKKYEYPLVIPIVLYTGKEKWNANLDLRSIQYKWNKYNGQELSRYNILDVNEINDIELLEENSMISKIMLIEKSKTEEELCENLNKIYDKINQNEIMYTEEEKQFLRRATEVLALNLFGEEKTRKILENVKVGGKEVMLAVFDMIKEEKRLRQIEFEKELKKKWNDGRLEGRAEGRNEGKIQAKIDDIKNMLKEKLPIDLISKITGVSEEEIKEYTNCKK